MKLITRDTDYALRALCFIAKNKRRRVSVSELVWHLRIPRPFLRKILQTLNRKNVLKSYKGQGGGFLLAQPVNKIILIDLLEIFQGPLQLNECLFKKINCPNTNTCLLRAKIKSIERYVGRQLKSITLSSLIKELAPGTRGRGEWQKEKL